MGDRAPSRIRIDAVKNAEARGSLTSLTGLIKRAQNFHPGGEKGQTGSKGSDWFGNDLYHDMSRKGKNTNSLGEVLDGFTFSPKVDRGTKRGSSPFDDKFETYRPAPTSGLAKKPTFAEPDVRELSSAGSRHRHGSSRSRQQPRNKCCGLPLWVFLTLLVCAIAIVALAIILPVTLILIPNQNKSDKTCPATHPCQNGGTSVTAPRGACQCICTEGYTGRSCDTSNTSGCSSVKAASVDATVGEDIAPLLKNGPGDFNVPLNSTAILGILADNDINCRSQNSLVYLNGIKKVKRSLDAPLQLFLAKPPVASKDGTAASATHLAPLSGPRPLLLNPHQQQKRAEDGGLKIDNSPPSSTSGKKPSTSSKSGSDSLGDFNPTSQRAHDFSRTAILYVLQETSDLNGGVVAGDKLQTFYTNVPDVDPKSVDLGSGWTANLVDETIKGHGKSVGSGSS